ncbi:TonB-dependent siderophore receptor [Ereboglobus luteus]|nr:TonB-dependent receptor plug domain-containing protein [Ereboglobus luteus]
MKNLFMKTPNDIVRAALAGLLPFAAVVPLFGQAVTSPVNDAPPNPTVPVITGTVNPVADDQEGEEVVTLEEFTVRASKDASYIGATATAGARVVADILELPFSIQVLSKDFIDDFQLLDFEDQAAYIGGMTPGDPATGAPSNSLRGYAVPVFRNGFRRTQRPESNSIRQTEVIRGPQSALFGRTSPGGVVNMLSKQPLTKFKTGATGIYGSYNNRRASAYVTGPLIRGKLFYRVDTEYYDMERNTDYWFDRTFNISGSVIYKFTPNTALSAEFEHSKKFMNDSTVGSYFIDRTDDPNYEQFLADPFNAAYQNTEYGKTYWRRVALSEYGDDDVRDRLMSFNAAGSERRTKRENDSFYLKLEHRFASDVSMRVNFGYSERDFTRDSLSSLSTWDPDWQAGYNASYVPASEHPHGNWGLQSGKWTQNDNNTAAYPGRRAQALHYEYDYKEYGFQIDFTKNWRTAIRQSSLLTFDYFREKSSFREWYLRGDPTATTGRNSALRAAIATMLGYPSAAQLPNEIWSAYISPDPFHLDAAIPLPGGRTISAKDLYSLTPSFDNATYPWAPRNGYDDVARLYSNIYDMDRLTYGALLSHQVSLFSDRVYMIGTIRQDFSEVERKIPFDWVLSEHAKAQALHPNVDLGNPIDMSNPAVAQIVKVGRENTGNTRAMSYSAGISYSVLKDKKLVAYVSYGKSFDPAMQVDPFKGTIFGNRTAKGVDAGIKGVLRASGGAVFQYEVAVYKIKEENAAVQNPLWEDNSNLASEVDDLSDLPDYYVPVTSKGQGMSIDIKGDNVFIRGLALNGKIDWLDKTYDTYPGRDDPEQPEYRVGGRFTNTPVRSVGAGASYKFQSGLLKGLKLGMSHTYTPRRLMAYFDPATSSVLAQDERWLPRQSLWHGFISYPRRFAKRLVIFQVNVVNIFDDMTITPGSYMPNGREVRGTITLEF